MEYTNKLCTDNRKRFVAEMQNSSIAIFVSNTPMPSNGDTCYSFQQNSNLLWICGISQEDTFVVIVKNDKKNIQEYLFIKEPNPSKEIWDGKFLTLPEAQNISGINTIYYTSSFESFLQQQIHYIQYIYLCTNENDRKNTNIKTAEDTFIKKIKKQYPLHHLERSASILKQCRSIKNSFEIEKIQHAINITEKTFKLVLKYIKPNVYEYEIQAEIIASFLKQKSSGFSFTPIFASGDNARILHYIENQGICKDGDLILMDFGATYQNYHADITRTIPVNGKFTNRQKEVYNVCLKLNRYAQSILKPNILLSKYTELVGIAATKEFIKLGLLTLEEVKNQHPQNLAYRKYLYHGISHHLGLDVHDLTDKDLPLKAGMILTVEPGIYIEQEKIGIRLEDNVLITTDGCKNLSKNIPIEVEDIEKIMQKKNL